MYSIFPQRLSRLGVNLFFLYASIFTLVLGIMMSRLSRRWIVSDWLINYEGGFVRRGLAGEVAYLLGHLLHITPIFFVTFFYISFILTFLFCARSLAIATSLNVWVLALVLNPATFSFQLLHPTAGFRKEIIFLAGLSLFAVLIKRKLLSPTGASIYLTLWIVLGILSHEAMTFYVPYLFAVLLISGRTFRQAAFQFAVPAAAGLTAFYLCSTHLGSRETAMSICSSLGYKFIVPGSQEICSGGAIPYLMRSREFARAETAATIHNYHFLLVFPAFAALALIPAVGESIALVRVGLQQKVIIIWSTVAVSFIGSIALFAFGIDWGRWIYVHVSSIAILLFFVDGSAQESGDVETVPSASIEARRRPLVLALLFAYATFWLLPNTYETPKWGYLERVGRVLHIWPKPSVPEVDPSNLS